MARQPRLSVPGNVHHVIQRGHNGQPFFHDAADYQQMLELVAEHAGREKVALHAYVLLPNELHLLLTPERDNSLSALMQALGRRYAQYFNRRHGRSGGLWNGRYKAAPLQAEAYLFLAMTYLDLAPVRAGLTSRPADYRWSSHRHYAGLQADKRLVSHALYWHLGNTPFAREADYAERVAQGLSDADSTALSQSLLKGWALGEPAFVARLQTETGRRLTPSKAGRPASVDKMT